MKVPIIILVAILIDSCSDLQSGKVNYDDDVKYFKTVLSEAKSPNGKRTLQLGELGNDSTNWTTQVLLDFGGCGGGVYAVQGRNLDIRTSWKGNDTILIETRVQYKSHQKHYWMQCFLEKIKIVYVEH